MGNREYEKAIFEALVDVDHCFLGEEIATWSQPPDESDFPDVICISVSGRRIGVELGEWLNEQQMASAKCRERAQASMLNALKPQPSNQTRHVSLVWLCRKPGAYVCSSVAGEFKDQLLACVEKCDSNDTLWGSPQGHFVATDELAEYPALANHLCGLILHRRDGGKSLPEGYDWICFPANGGWYSEDLMVTTLLNLLDDKRRHYGSTGSGFNYMCLVVYYNRAVVYNSPVETPTFKFEDAVALAARAVCDDKGPFDSIFVFDAALPAGLFRVC